MDGSKEAMMVAALVRITDDGMGLDEAIAAYLTACEVEGKTVSHGLEADVIRQ